MRRAENRRSVKDVRSLVDTARDASRSLGERHDAFAELVASYQDMAFGCAYAVLGDFYLAEDAAQEAFVSAWQTLHQLRVPEAFSGWLRRIVLTRCNRLTRGQRLQIVPLELGTNAPSPALDPQSAIEQRDMRAKVRAAIQALPDKERLVTTLFYVNGYTQTDIGEFLEVPLTTVTKRLYSARQHLKKSAVVEIFKKDLQRQRPSRNDAFAEKVNAKLRPLSKHDCTALLTIASAVDESHTEENELWLRRRQKFDRSLYIRRHSVAE